jgi:cell division protein FtsB
MDWNLYEENKKNKEDREMYKTGCRILGVVILIIFVLWYAFDNKRIKRIEELNNQIAVQEEQIEELKSKIEYLEEYGE